MRYALTLLLLLPASALAACDASSDAPSQGSPADSASDAAGDTAAAVDTRDATSQTAEPIEIIDPPPDTDTDAGPVCYAESYCTNPVVCDAGNPTVLLGRENVDCHAVCGPGPCQGGACVAGARTACGADEVCVEHAPDAGLTTACTPKAAVCGGPERLGCAEGEYCELLDGELVATEYVPGQTREGGCEAAAAGKFGVCKPTPAECDGSDEGDAFCACTLDAQGAPQYRTFWSQCERKRAGHLRADPRQCFSG